MTSTLGVSVAAMLHTFTIDVAVRFRCTIFFAFRCHYYRSELGSFPNFRPHVGKKWGNIAVIGPRCQLRHHCR